MEIAGAERQQQLDDDEGRFLKSLKELRDLRMQLHQAADHCESAFRGAAKKRIVVENTKGYIEQAMVTVIDHLGNVSANMDCLLHGLSDISNIQSRVHWLMQRILTWNEFTATIDLFSVRRSTIFPMLHTQYLLPSIAGNFSTMQKTLREQLTTPDTHSPSSLQFVSIAGPSSDSLQGLSVSARGKYKKVKTKHGNYLRSLVWSKRSG